MDDVNKATYAPHLFWNNGRTKDSQLHPLISVFPNITFGDATFFGAYLLSNWPGTK